MNNTLVKIIAATSFAIAVPVTASAQHKQGSSKVGKSKASPNQKSRSEVQKMLSRDVKKVYGQLRTVETRLADFDATLKASPSLRRESGANRAVKEALAEHAALKRQLTQLNKVKFADYAARRGISMVPNAPRTPPPPLPQPDLVVPPAKESSKQFKSRRPPGG